MKRILPLPIAFSLLFAGIACNSSHTHSISLPTRKEKGWGHMSPTFTPMTFFNADSSSPWYGIKKNFHILNVPDTFQEVRISINPTSWDQFVYQYHRKGWLATDFFRKLHDDWHIDTTLLTPHEIHCYFVAAIGKDASGKMYYILDRNNDLDFSNDTASPMIRYDPFQPVLPDTLPPKVESFRYEYVQGGKVHEDSSWVRFFMSFGNIYMQIMEHRKADLVINKKHYPLEIKTMPHITDYHHFSKVVILDANRASIPERQWLSIGEYLIIPPGRYFRIERITMSGDTIVLKHDREAEERGGSQEGMKALDFTATTLDGRKIRLSDYRGKWVILEFWGTWCGPCVSFLPTLQELYDQFHDKGLEIIAIANDKPETVKKFLAQHPHPWPQIPQYPPDHDTLLKMYHISGYPTTYLIDPKGKIISTHYREQLRNIVAVKLLNEQEKKEKYLEGNVHFELEGHENAFPIFVRIYPPHSRGKSYPMIRYEGKWQRNVDLAPGEYTYEFLVEDQRLPDPANPNKRWTLQKDRQISVLQIPEDDGTQ